MAGEDVNIKGSPVPIVVCLNINTPFDVYPLNILLYVSSIEFKYILLNLSIAGVDRDVFVSLITIYHPLKSVLYEPLAVIEYKVLLLLIAL